MGIPARMTRWTTLGLVALAGALLSPSPARATTMVELTTDQLVDASEAIVQGTVVEVWTELDEQGAVWTRAQVEVGEVLKGDPTLEAVVVDQRGGTYAGRTYQIGGAVRFSVGEEAVIFLETLGNGRTVPVGMVQGKFTIQMDPYLREPIARRFALPFGVDYDARFLPLQAEGERLTLEALEEQVRERVREGWDGQPIPGASTERLRQINSIRSGAR